MVSKQGGAIKNALLSLYNIDRWVVSINADDDGRFSFKVYGDFEYSIVARMSDGRNGISDRVPIGEKSTDLTLVLKP